MLALTKRTTAIHTDIAKAMMNLAKFEEKIALWVHYRDNYGIKVLDVEETMEQFDTALGELDAVIMSQYQLVAAASEVPATKLLGTTPKGFNSTGEYDESSYHEMLESIQENDLTRLVDRHHELAIKSEISPGAPFPVEISWKPLDTPTAAELADINQKKAATGQALSASGAIDGVDERNRLINDPDSGYANIEPISEDLNDDEENDDSPDADPSENDDDA